MIFFVVALLIGLSRNYLVQHFFQDIYLGALIGFGLSILFYWGQNKFFKEETHWLNRSIFNSGEIDIAESILDSDQLLEKNRNNPNQNKL